MLERFIKNSRSIVKKNFIFTVRGSCGIKMLGIRDYLSKNGYVCHFISEKEFKELQE